MNPHLLADLVAERQATIRAEVEAFRRDRDVTAADPPVRRVIRHRMLDRLHLRRPLCPVC
jgi:hypothetical protein